MYAPYQIPVWKTAPFVRLLIPLTIGIALQWYLQFSLPIIIVSVISFAMAILLFQLLPLSVKFKWQPLQGIILHLLLGVFGLFITWQKNVTHHNNWFGNYYQQQDQLVIKINEPLVEKTKSYKAEGNVEAVIHNNEMHLTKGKVLLYFLKDSSARQLHYGDKILINKNLQLIKNSGNPGAFNYQRYAAFQQFFHNVFLKENDWVKLGEKNINVFDQFIFTARGNILSVLQKNIKGNNNELGIAEALLIGYKEDLDKDLVQAYSNTGVVHIIAISGLHLGLIYIMLLWILNRLPIIKKSKITKVVLLLSCLWLFSILTGASASVLRSAVMFTCIVIGENFAKKSSIYNSLAVSAFLLLCYNPYFLWDVGFQLSYLAVLGIVIFQHPVYGWLYVKNKWVDKVWQLIAVSLAAQLLTTAICIYYFHQFPNYFLLANLITVPLSSIILFAEIFLIAFAWIPSVGEYMGKAIQWMVWLMNRSVEMINQLPFSVWDSIAANIFSTWLLYAAIISLCIWLMNKNKSAFQFSLIMLLAFIIEHAYNNWKIQHQQTMIVYNVPKYPAIDFVKGNDYQFVGDSILLKDGVLQNFHIKPARIELQLTNPSTTTFTKQPFYQFNNKKIVHIDRSITFGSGQKIEVDYIILSRNAKVSISNLSQTFNCRQYIFDASNSLWKIEQWKKDCEALLLRCYSIPEQGAFILNDQ